MIWLRCQNPTCRRPHEIVRTTRPTATASAVRSPSAGGDELSDLAVTLGAPLGGFRLGQAHQRRREHGKGDEREEPRDVEIEPVRQYQLEADEKRARERCELEGRL